MSIEDEVNYKGYTIKLVGIPCDMPNFWRAFYDNTFIVEGATRDEAIRLAQPWFDGCDPEEEENKL